VIVVNLKRTATIVVVGAAFAAWLSAAIAPAGRSNIARGQATASAVETRSTDLEQEIARLHDRLRPDATPREPGRNLFAFHSALSRPAAPLPTPTRPALSELPPIAALPMLKLEGIAENDASDAVVRTAIISDGVELHLVKEGEAVTPRYLVAKISADVVELTDVGDGSVRRLALK
jgi:hypothetical protein